MRRQPTRSRTFGTLPSTNPHLTLASICLMGPESFWGMVPFGTLPELSAIAGLAEGPVGVRSTYPGTATP
jgi:hypothetical protein